MHGTRFLWLRPQPSDRWMAQRSPDRRFRGDYYEEGSEYSILDGPTRLAKTSGESPSTVPAGERDLANESFYEYGSRVGGMALDGPAGPPQYQVTFYACALALERNPDVATEIVRRGHEVMGHGNRWEEYYKMDRDTEREAIRQAVASIAKSTGERPLGWYTRYGPSVNTRELVVEEGGFEYDCNAYNDDLPYYTKVHGNPWLVVPYSLEVNDYKFWRGDLITPGHFFETAKASFDVLYEEGAAHPKMMSVGLHCRIIGKPSRSQGLAQFLEYASAKEGVWFARRVEIARWWKENYKP